MTIGQQLKGNFPKSVNKNDSIFQALVASDNGDGTFEKVLQSLKDYMTEWTETSNVYDQSGDMLTKTINFFSFLKAFTDESEKSLKNRVSAIFVRNHDTVWGTPHNIKKVFEQYFPSGNIYLVENVNDTTTDNLLVDMDFSSTDTEYWTIQNCEISTKARFSKTYGVILSSSTSSCSQSVTLELTDKTTYFLHFFLKGSVKVRITASDGTYWDNTNKEWTETDSTTTFTKDEWNNANLWFICPSSITSITVEFIGIDNTIGYVDYVRLFEKQSYPSFEIIAQFTGDSEGDALALAPGSEDTETPIPGSYDKMGYYDNIFFTGASAGFAQDLYEDLLDYVRAQGVKAYIHIVNKDYIEDEEE